MDAERATGAAIRRRQRRRQRRLRSWLRHERQTVAMELAAPFLRFLVRKLLEEKERRQEEEEQEKAAPTSASSAPKRTRKKRKKRRLPRGVRIRRCGQGSRSVFPLVVDRPEMPCIMAGMYQMDSSSFVVVHGSGKCLAGLAGYDAPHVMFPSGVDRPRMLCILAGVDQKDSCSGMYKAGIAGDSAPRAVFLPIVKPKMRCIMAGMDQRYSCVCAWMAARNRVSRPAIAENMDELEEKFKKWKKDIAYLKDIDAYDYRDNGMISILLDFVPDEVHKEITMKYATVGSNAIDLRTAMLEVERIIEREKDRVQSRSDRQTEGKISALQEGVAEDLHVWNNEAYSGYGGFVLAAKRVRQGEEDEEEAQQERSVRGKVETETGEVQQRSGKAKGEAESRKCFTCGEEGHFKA